MHAVNMREDLQDELERQERERDGERGWQCSIISTNSLADWT